MHEDGIFLPQEINISAVMTTGQREYIEQWEDENSKVCETEMLNEKNDRVVLGEILRLTPESIDTLEDRILDKYTTLIECGEILLPELTMKKPLLVICTQITIYNEERLGEYDSGITHPLPDMHVCVNFIPNESKPGDLLVKTGDKLKFYYRLNGLPGFLATVAN